MKISAEQIELIAQRVTERLGQKPASAARASDSAGRDSLTDGVFADIDSAAAAAWVAQKQLIGLSMAKRQEIIANIRQVLREHTEDLARAALNETGLGRLEDKIIKNQLVIEKTPGTEDLTPRAGSGDRGLMLVEPAPYGVIGAITPITNPTSTIICNSIGMVAAGNSVVFNVHPGASKVSVFNVQLLNRAIVGAGGPSNVVTTVADPTIESAQELMAHPRIRLLVVTGGEGVVKVAMRSGKRAICAGPGNPPVVVDETADLDQAGRDIVQGASFDNNIVCVLEKEIIAVDQIADDLKKSLVHHNCVEVKDYQLRQLEKVIFQETHGPGKPGVMNKEYIGKCADVILRQIGVNVGKEIRMAIVEVDRDHPLFLTEQMMPVMPLVRVRNADEGIDLAVRAEQGFGHTAMMHSKNIDNLSRMAREINCSIFVKNGPSVAGLGYGGEGYTSFSIASPTGEGLTSARSFTRDRRCVLVDHFRIV
ncbi:aldehyde dehydrogenase family protein [Candidatus Zixiibacteriota bacterium]